MKKPTVFVSSTCYDLRQIREDMYKFIEKELGYEALLSEKDVFPIRSELNAVENCIQTVEQQADIFLLIIGGRYGQLVGDMEKSITNLEYETARKKGIPTYIFVDEKILDLLPIWEKNKNGDFSDAVDSNKVFEFVADLNNAGKNWIFKFRSAQDIIEKVRSQFAFLLNDGLILKRKYFNNVISEKILKYSGKVFRIAVEKPLGWEYLLFIEALSYNLEQQQDLKYDLLYGMYLNESVLMEEPHEILNMCQTKFGELLHIVDSVDILMNQGLKDAVGKLGEPGNADYIIYIAERVVDVYKTAGRWTLNFKKYIVPDEFQRLLEVMAKCANGITDTIEAFVPMAREKMKLALLQKNNETIKITMEIDLDEKITEEISRELEKLDATF